MPEVSPATEYLFIGGPLAGWRRGPDGHRTWRYYPTRTSDSWVADASPLTETDRIGTYTPRRFCHPSWRVLLTFYVCDAEFPGTEPDLPRGTVLPGAVVGKRFECEPVSPTAFGG